MIRLYPDNKATQIPVTGQTSGKIRLYSDTTISQPTQKTRPISGMNFNLGLPEIGGMKTSTPTVAPQGALTTGEYLKGIPMGIVEQYKNPSEIIKGTERALGVGEVSPVPGGKLAQIPYDFAVKAVVRTFGPFLQPLGKDISDIVMTYELAPKVASGELPIEVLDQLDSLKKTNLQLAGDVAQAVLIAYSPTLLGKNALLFKGAPIKTALLGGGLRGAITGAGFGVAQTLSSGTKDPAEMAKIMGQSILVMGVLGAITSGVVPVTKEVFKKVVETKNVIKQNAIKEGYSLAEAEIIANKGGIKIPVKGTPGATGEVKIRFVPIEERGATQIAQKAIKEAISPEKGTIPQEARIDLSKAKITKEFGFQGQGLKEVKTKVMPTEITTPPKPIETESIKQLKSSVFERMKAENPQLEGKLGYDPIKLEKDIGRAVDLIATDKQKAFNVAMGAETLPNITSTAVNIAMSEKALAEGNIDLYSRLIKNRSLEQTRRGQEIVSERGSITDNSTSKYVKELIASRLESLGRKYLGDLENVVKKTTDKGKAIKVIDREVAKVEKQIKLKKLDVKTALSLLEKLTCLV